MYYIITVRDGVFVKYNLSASEKIILDTVRKHNNLMKSEIVELSNLPWATVSNSISSLIDKKLLETISIENRDTLCLIPDEKYFVGIAVGTSNIKIAISDIDCIPITNINNKTTNVINNINKKFNLIFEKTLVQNNENVALWCISTPDSYVDLCSSLNNICKTILEETDSCLNIVSMCFVFPGIIDIESQTIVKSNYSGLILKTSDIESILNDDIISDIKGKNILIRIDHNVKSCGFYELSEIEKENRINNKDNLAVLYLGTGLGVAFFVFSRLIRSCSTTKSNGVSGYNNESGQLGHIYISKMSDEYISNFFSTGEQTTHEKNVFLGNDILENVLMDEVFFKLLNNNSSCDRKEMKIKYKNTKAEELKKLLLQEESKLLRQKLAYYLGSQIINITKLLSINTFVLSGKLSELYPAFKSELQYVFMESDCPLNINIITSSNGEYSAALGALEIAYKNYFGIQN